MNNFTKNKGLNIMLLMLIALTTNSFSGTPPIDHKFNYQGQLLDNGSPANGNYDISVSGFFFEEGGSVQGQISEHLNTPVSNGLFNLTGVDIIDEEGTNPFDGYTLFLEVSVKPAGEGSYVALSPRQLMQAVPYANNIIIKGASAGQVLTYTGSGQWEPETPNDSPWVADGSDISFTNGNVGIGVSSSSSALSIQSGSPSDSLLTVRNNSGFPRLEVSSNGGLKVGNHIGSPPERGISVDGDTRQLGTANGMLKYMVKVNCTAVDQSLVSSYNGTIGSGSITVSAFDVSAGACGIAFPSGVGNITDLNNRYWVATPIGGSNLIVTCERAAARNLNCRRTVASSGASAGGQFMVLVY